jgi:tetratricopeptide (TPR) repeat protein
VNTGTASNAPVDITTIKAEAELPKQALEQPIDDGKPKIRTPIETVTEERFSQPAQVVSAASGTSITPAAAEMLKPPEEKKKPVTVAETDAPGFSEILSSTSKAHAQAPLSASELFQGAAIPGAGAANVSETAAPEAAKNTASDTATSGDDIVKNVIAAAAAEREEAAKQPQVAQAAAETPVGQTPSQASIQAAVKLYNAAVNAHFAGKLGEAIAYYKGALAANPTLAEAHSNLGLIYNQQHHYAEAITEFRKALAINPKDAITYNGIGAALRAERDLIGAIKNWQTAVSLEPKLATAHYNLGTAYEMQKEYDKAFNSYLAAVKNDRKLGDAYYRLGILMERKHRMQEAQDYFAESLRSPNAGEYAVDAKQRLKLLQASNPKSAPSQTY